MYVSSCRRPGEAAAPVAVGGQTFFTLVSKGTMRHLHVGLGRELVDQPAQRAHPRGLGDARGHDGSPRPARRSRLPSCEPGGSETHIEPDWSMTITTFTGKPVGFGGAVHTRPLRVSRLSRLRLTCASGSTQRGAATGRRHQARATRPAPWRASGGSECSAINGSPVNLQGIRSGSLLPRGGGGAAGRAGAQAKPRQRRPGKRGAAAAADPSTWTLELQRRGRVALLGVRAVREGQLRLELDGRTRRPRRR